MRCSTFSPLRKPLWTLVAFLAGVTSVFGQSIALGPQETLLNSEFYDGSASGLEPASAGGRAAFLPAINPTGGTVAFWTASYDALDQATLALFLVDIGNPSSWRRLTVDQSFGPEPISWTPNSASIFTGSRRVDVATGQIENTSVQFGFPVRDVSITPVNEGYLGIALLNFSNFNDPPNSIASARLTASGTVGGDPNVPQGSILTIPSGQQITGLAVSRGATALAFAVQESASTNCGVDSDHTNLYVVEDILEILTNPGTQINSLTDPRVVPIRVSPGASPEFVYLAGDSFSEDGGLIFYSEDFAAVYSECDPLGTLENADFDIMLSNASGADLPNTLDGDLRLTLAGNQRISDASAGGLRLLIEGAGTNTFGHSEIFISTLVFASQVAGTDVSNTLINADTDGDSIPDTPLTLGDNAIQLGAPASVGDASGTNVLLPAGTYIDFPSGAPHEISIRTPVEPIDPGLLPPGDPVASLALVRDFGPDGTYFYPPVQVTIHYTDDELSGNSENGIAVFLFNTGTNEFERIPDEFVIDIDANQNTVTFLAQHFSVFGIGFGDGVPAVPLSKGWIVFAAILFTVGFVWRIRRGWAISDPR